MYEQVDRLQDLLKKVADTVVVAKKSSVTAEQVLKAEDINLGEGATLNIQMNQFVIDKNTEKWLDEAMQIARLLSDVVPNHGGLEFTEAVNNYKLGLVKNAMVEFDGNKRDIVKKLGIPRSTLANYLRKL